MLLIRRPLTQINVFIAVTEAINCQLLSGIHIRENSYEGYYVVESEMENVGM